jgi:hypothetical protein
MRNLTVVDGLVATGLDDTDLTSFTEAMSIALDQRYFGPRRLLVAFAERGGRMRARAAATRTDPIDFALRACIQHLGEGASAAIAFNDEPVEWGPPPADLATRFWGWQATCRASGIHLVDWISCDDQTFRSTKLAIQPDDEWWDAPHA